MEDRPTNEKLQALFSRKRDLASLRWRLAKDTEKPERSEHLDRFLLRLLGAQEEVKDAANAIWQLKRADRDEKVRSLKQIRQELCQTAFDDLDESWMRTAGTTGYWLEVALDLEGVLHSFSALLLTHGRFTGWFFKPAWVVVTRGLGSLFYFATACVVLYFLFGGGYSWLGWILAVYFGWLIYRRTKRADRLDRDTARWTENLLLIESCRTEIASDCFDAFEVARRLRQQEKNGLFVQSTIFKVIRMNATVRVKSDMGAVSHAARSGQ